MTERPPGYSLKLWARLLPGDRQRALVRYWESLPAVTQRMLIKKYGVT